MARPLRYFIVLAAGFLMLAVVSTLRTPGHLWILAGTFGGCPARPSCVSSRAEDEAHRIAPLVVEASGEELRSRLEALLSADPQLRIVHSTPRYLHAMIVSRWGLRDDLELLIGDDGVIEVRSLSRFGFDDRGANRARVEALRSALGR